MKLLIVVYALLLCGSLMPPTRAQQENHYTPKQQVPSSPGAHGPSRHLLLDSIWDFFSSLLSFEVCRGETTLRLNIFSLIFGLIFRGDSLGACPEPPTPSPPMGPHMEIFIQLVSITEDAMVFSDAEARWESIITAGYEGQQAGSNLPPLTDFPSCMYPATVEDIYICAIFEPIDGPGTVLGSAGPVVVFTSGPNINLPVVGAMRFDEADIADLRADGTLSDVILHEMGHVLGIGTLWELTGVAGSDADGCPYTGTSANQEYEDITSCTVVPTEQDFGPGTRCGHWDEDCLQNELMTGLLTGTELPLSRITIGTLEDMGYQVDYTQADAYTAADVDSGCVCSRRVLEETQQLGLGSPETKPRRLSEAARAVAVAYGTAELKRRSEAFKGLRVTDTYTYVGDKVISVIVRDNDGSIFRIVVHAT